MADKKYEFDNRKPGFASKFGSTVIAVGSVATAISIAMPSVGSFVVEQTAAAGAAFGVNNENQAEPGSVAAAVAETASGSNGSSPVSTPVATTQSVTSGSGSAAVQIETHELTPNLPIAVAATPAPAPASTSSTPTATAPPPPKERATVLRFAKNIYYS